MDFKIVFKAVGKDGYVMKKPVKRIGLNQINKLKNDLGLDKVNLDLIAGHAMKRNKKEVKVSLDMEEALKINEINDSIFTEDNEVIVNVDEEQLNDYLTLDYSIEYSSDSSKESKEEIEEVEYSDENKEIENIKFQWVLDKQQVLDAWISEGCPKNWGEGLLSQKGIDKVEQQKEGNTKPEESEVNL